MSAITDLGETGKMTDEKSKVNRGATGPIDLLQGDTFLFLACFISNPAAFGDLRFHCFLFSFFLPLLLLFLSFPSGPWPVLAVSGRP